MRRGRAGQGDGKKEGGAGGWEEGGQGRGMRIRRVGLGDGEKEVGYLRNQFFYTTSMSHCQLITFSSIPFHKKTHYYSANP